MSFPKKIRDFAKFIGTIIACCPAIKYSWIYTKNFEKEKYLALLNSNGKYNATMLLSPNRVDYNWWKIQILLGSNSIENPEFDIDIFTDASTTGWGAVHKSMRAHSFWIEHEKKHHINYLELKAAYFGLKCFAKELYNVHILFRIDNTTAISYINRMGGIQFENLNNIKQKHLYFRIIHQLEREFRSRF